MIGSDGEYSTKKEQDSKSKHTNPIISFKFEIKRFEIFENGAAIVSGTRTIHRKNDQGEYDLIYQPLNVLIKRNNDWKAISSHIGG